VVKTKKNFRLLEVFIDVVQSADIQLYQIFRPCFGVDSQDIVLTVYIYDFVSRLNTANFVLFVIL